MYFCVLVPVAFLSPKLVLSLPGEYALKILEDLCKCCRRMNGALEPCQHTLSLWRWTSALPSSAMCPLPFALTTPAPAAFLASPCSRSAKGLCQLEGAGLPPSHLGALTTAVDTERSKRQLPEQTLERFIDPVYCRHRAFLKIHRVRQAPCCAQYPHQSFVHISAVHY